MGCTDDLCKVKAAPKKGSERRLADTTSAPEKAAACKTLSDKCTAVTDKSQCEAAVAGACKENTKADAATAPCIFDGATVCECSSSAAALGALVAVIVALI